MTDADAEDLQVAILAGGLGTRMAEVSRGAPKALVPVAGEPFAYHQLSLLASQGVRRVVFCVGFGADRVRAFVGDGSRWGLDVAYVDEGETLLGTAGALRGACNAGVLDESFGVLYGDSYLPIDLTAVTRAFQASGLPALMTVLLNKDRWDASNAVFRRGRVVRYDKRPEARVAEMLWIDYGFSIFERELIVDRVAAGAVVDLAELVGELSAAGLLAGLEVTERFYEVGSPRGRDELEAHLTR